jgi:hypothetical protein
MQMTMKVRAGDESGPGRGATWRRQQADALFALLARAGGPKVQAADLVDLVPMMTYRVGPT